MATAAVKKILTELTADQRAAMPGWGEKWIAIGLSTERMDLARFEEGARACYRFAGLDELRVVVPVSSPLALSLAAPIASYLLATRPWERPNRRKGAVGDAVRGAVGDAVRGAVEDAVKDAVGDAVRGAVRGAVEDAVRDAVGDAVRGAVRGAVEGAVRGAVRDAVRDAVGGAVGDAVRGAVEDAVGDAVRGAVGGAVEGAVRGAVGGAVGDAVRGAVEDAVGGAVRGAVGGAVRDAVRDAVGGAVEDAVGDAVRGAVGGAVRDAVEGAVRDAVRDAVGGAVRGAVGGAVRDAVRDAVGDAVEDAVGDAVRGAVRDAVRDAVEDAWYYYLGGQFWVGWGWSRWGGSPSVTSFYREVCGLSLPGDIWDRARAYQATAESACWWWPHREFVMVSDRPRVIHRDARGRLHCEDGPAIAWGDGFGVYSWHGVRVSREVIEHPDALTAEQIQSEPNVEIRRVMLERFGHARYAQGIGAQVLHRDVDGLGNPRTLWSAPRAEDTPLVMVEIVNSTPELDGTTRTYWLRVPPMVRTCQEAVAWTFGIEAAEYVLMAET